MTPPARISSVLIWLGIAASTLGLASMAHSFQAEYVAASTGGSSTTVSGHGRLGLVLRAIRLGAAWVGEHAVGPALVALGPAADALVHIGLGALACGVAAAGAVSAARGAASARLLVRLARARARRRTGRCHACGYDLAGLRAVGCPECGAWTTASEPAAPDATQSPPIPSTEPTP